MKEIRENIEQARKEAKTWSFQHLAGITIMNTQSQMSITISKNGLKHTLGLYRTNKEFELEALRTIHQLPQLLESASLVQTEPDTTNKRLTNVYRFRATYIRDGVTYTVGIVLKEQRLNDAVKVFYDHHIISRA
jgi:Large polyvalent protein-associated domain 3